MMRNMLIAAGTGLVVFLTACAGGLTPARATSEADLIEQKFAEWRDGTGSPFDLLAEDADWTVEGSGRLAGTYDRGGLVEGVVEPFNAVLASPLRPDVPAIYRDGSTVIAVFSASARLKSGGTYSNRYAWIMTFEGEEVVRVNAFLDLAAFERVFPFGEQRRGTR